MKLARHAWIGLATAIVSLVVLLLPGNFVNAASGLIAGYPFATGSGTTAADVSGNGLTGTLVGATWTTGKYGFGLAFDGSSNYVDLGNPSALQLTSSATFSAWVNAASVPRDDGVIIAKSQGALGWQLKTSPDSGQHRFAIGVTGPGNTWVQRNSATVRALNTWYHVAGVYNAAAQTLDIYVNGVLDDGVMTGIGPLTVPASQVNNAGANVTIGRRADGYYFSGVIDEVRVYGRALAPTEIQSDMNTPLAGVADTQPPTAPGTPVPAVISGSEIDVSWPAATDNVGVTGYLLERCQGVGCSSFAQIATPAGTAFNDTGLTALTSYSYRVRATDAASNLSDYSSVATQTTAATSPPVFVTETHSATDGCCGLQFNNATLNLNVTGTDRLLMVAWHSEWDGSSPDRTVPDPGAWSVTNNGVPGTVIADTNGYTGGDGNRRFRIYYWLNPPVGTNTISVSNPNTGANELSVSAMLFTNVDQTNPLGDVVLDVSTTARTAESETVSTTPPDLVVHVIADALLIRGNLGPGETSLSVVNDGLRPEAGDASLWISSKPGTDPTTTVSSSGWWLASVMNGVGIVLHGR